MTLSEVAGNFGVISFGIILFGAGIWSALKSRKKKEKEVKE